MSDPFNNSTYYLYRLIKYVFHHSGKNWQQQQLISTKLLSGEYIRPVLKDDPPLATKPNSGVSLDRSTSPSTLAPLGWLTLDILLDITQKVKCCQVVGHLQSTWSVILQSIWSVILKTLERIS